MFFQMADIFKVFLAIGASKVVLGVGDRGYWRWNVFGVFVVIIFLRFVANRYATDQRAFILNPDSVLVLYSK